MVSPSSENKYPSPAGCHWSACPHGHDCVHAPTEHIAPDMIDGGCLVCAECDGDEGHDGMHDCEHA